ncbi:MAG TPA: hypothetical protein DCM28_08485 [Phycisphaerales bacterium]|nr:hypothetical protein [Phycisphaerales bacterium]
MFIAIKRTPVTVSFIVLLACVGILTNKSFAKEVAAVSVDTFIDSMGINLHHLDSNERAWVTELGFRHIRDNSLAYPGSADESALTELYNTFGIKTGFPARTQWTIAQQVAFARNDFIDWVEGINEPDGANPAITYNGLTDRDSGADDYDATIAFQNDLYAALKADPQTSSLAVLPPAMAYVNNSRHISNLSFDIGSIHYYAGGRQPIGGPGGPVLASVLNDALWLKNPKNNDMPIIVSEVGYHTYTNQPGHPGISEMAFGKYAPRIFAEYFKQGIMRTYLYQLRDDIPPVNPPKPMEYYFGLVDLNGNKRQPYWRIKNMITLLSDTTTWNGSSWNYPNFTAGAMDYTLTGETQNVRQLLLQKSNGEFYLLLWQEVSSYDYSTHTDISNPNAVVSLNINTPIERVETFLLDSTTAKASYSNHRSITLNVPDEVMVVRLVPRSLSFPWSQSDIGSVALSGSSEQSGNLFTIKASGQDMFSTADQFRYVYQKLHGDGYIIARIESMEHTSGSARAGLMMRQSTNSGSEHVSIFARPGGERAFHWRAVANTNAQTLSTQPISGPYWLKLARTGDTFKGYYSTDGSNWTLAGTQIIPMNWEIFVGMAVTSATNSELNTAIIEQTYLSHQQVIVKPVDAIGHEGTSPLDTATFAIQRSGYIYSTLPVTYTLQGSADWNSDYTSTSWIANFPAGVDSLYVSIDPVNDAHIEADKTVVLKLQSGANYGIGNAWQAQATLYDDEKIGTFESASVPAEWNATGQPRSSVAIDIGKSDPAGGAQSLRWTYNDNDIDRWGNEIRCDFALPQDWQWANKLTFRFASPASVSGKTIYVNIRNNGIAPTSSGIAQFHLAPNAEFQDIVVDLSGYERDQITSLFFYLDGEQFPGNPSGGIDYHFNIDQVALFDHVDVADFEDSDLAVWTTQTYSTVSIETTQLDVAGGKNALKWTFNADGSSAWGNEIVLNPSTPLDWTCGKVLKFRFATTSSLLAGKHIFLNIKNNGVGYSSSGVGSYVLPDDSLYHDVTIPLVDVPRDLVTHLSFYVYGLEFAAGSHTFLIDNIRIE